jgi:hypothetical protein
VDFRGEVQQLHRGQEWTLAPVHNFLIINTLTVTPQGRNDRNSGRAPVS